MFNVAHCMPGILEAESWRVIMAALQRVEKVLSRYLEKEDDKPDFGKIRDRVNESVMNNPVVSERYREEVNRTKMTSSLPSSEIIRSVTPSLRPGLESNQVTKNKTSNISRPVLSKATLSKDSSYQSDISDVQADLEILKSALDSLFSSTFMHEDRVLIEFLKGLGKLTISMLEDSGVAKSVIPTKKKEAATFGIVRILEVTLINMHRIDIIWDTVIMNELALISSCKHEWLTSIAMEAICVIIEELFDKRVRTEQLRLEMDIEEAYEDKEGIASEASLDENWIQKIFEPLTKQIDTEFEKNKFIILNCIGNILQKHGNYLNNSIWSNILKIILVIGKSKNKDCVNQGFKNLKLIIGDYIT